MERPYYPARMDLEVFFAGTAGSVPTGRRGMPALLVRRGGERLLFDCGEGTQRQLVASVGLADLDAVFLTHYHLDHWLGIPGLLKTFALRDRDRPLRLHGPAGLKNLMGTLRPIVGRLPYDLRLVELEPGEPVQGDGYRVAPFRVEHRTARAFGYAVVEDERPGEFDPVEAQRLGVEPGPDFGRLQRGETVDGVAPGQVMGPPRPGRKVVISGDTAPSDAVRVAAHEADLLVHEATFLDEERERAKETAHSTARQAAEVASDAQVRMLALVHLSTRYFARDVRDEARAAFANTVIPRDFDAVELPFPERGEPHLVRWDEREPEPVG
jgi:ribonuclease Z